MSSSLPSFQPVDSSATTTCASDGDSSIWVFGYGSLCWNPGFAYTRSRLGYVKGFARKFWQGSATHRGTETQPGRVVTLVEADDEHVVWGRAFEVVVNSTALPYLEKREHSYICATVAFFPLEEDAVVDDDESAAPLPARTYIADPRNRWWLGEAPLEDICMQIVRCRGESGHNVEYLLKLAEYVRTHLPADRDPELFRLEALVREQLRRQRVNVNELMGRTGHQCGRHDCKAEAAPGRQFGGAAGAYDGDFTNRLPDKKLRCVNI